MVAIKSLIVSALSAAVALAQAPNASFSSSDIQSLLSGSGSVNTGSDIRVSWCISQRSLCGTLCSGYNGDNQCNSDTLSWECHCSNGSTPGIQYYSTSVVANECNALLGNCLAANANDAPAQENCMSTYVCGNATIAQASSAAAGASTPSATASMTTSASGTTSPSASATDTKKNAAPGAHKVYGPGAIAMAVLVVTVLAL